MMRFTVTSMFTSQSEPIREERSPQSLASIRRERVLKLQVTEQKKGEIKQCSFYKLLCAALCDELRWSATVWWWWKKVPALLEEEHIIVSKHIFHWFLSCLYTMTTTRVQLPWPGLTEVCVCAVNKQWGQKKKNLTRQLLLSWKFCYSQRVVLCVSWWVTQDSAAPTAATPDSG